MRTDRWTVFRILVAATTLLHHLPHFEGMIRGAVTHSFHQPLLPWLPEHSPRVLLVLIPLRRLLGWTLLLGLFPRLSAGLLAATGFYVFLLDSSHYSNTAYFHLILLGLLAFPQPWSERLIRIQISIVFFYSALEKVLSPFWGTSGLMLSELAAQRFWVLPPGVGWGGVGLEIIALEFFLAAALAYPPWWGAGIAAGAVFAVALEITMRPALFAWDLLAGLFLFLPANGEGRLRPRLPLYLLGILYLIFAVLRFWKPGFFRFC